MRSLAILKKGANGVWRLHREGGFGKGGVR